MNLDLPGRGVGEPDADVATASSAPARYRRKLALWALLLLAPAAHGCEPCARDACEAAERPAGARAIEQGIAGFVSYESDAGSNGCFPCARSTARLDVWPAPGPVTTVAEAEALIAAGPSSVTIMADGQYQRALPPGAYLVCVLPGACAQVSLGAGQVATVNVQRVYGPTGLVVFDPGASTRRPGRGLPVKLGPAPVLVDVEDAGSFIGAQAARLSVREPRGAASTILQLSFGATRGERQLSFILSQLEGWPLRARFELGLPPTGAEGSYVSEIVGGRHVAAHAGSVEIQLEGTSRFSGSLDAILTVGGDTRVMRGRLLGGLSISCQRLVDAGGTRVDDPRFESPFCADFARRAGLQP